MENDTTSTKKQLLQEISQLKKKITGLENTDTKAKPRKALKKDDEKFLHVVWRDITDRKKADEILRETELKSRIWLDNSPVCTKIVDLDFKLQFMSNSGIEDLNIDDISVYYGKPYPLPFYPDSFKIHMKNNLKEVKETGKIITQEAKVVSKDGREIWYQSTLVPVRKDEL